MGRKRMTESDAERKLKQWNKEWDESGEFPPWDAGTVLTVKYDQGSTLQVGQHVVVCDMDRFPTKKREFIRRYGYQYLAFVVCVQRMDEDRVEFYTRPRFRVAEGVAQA